MVRQFVPAPKVLGPLFGVPPEAVMVMLLLTASWLVHTTLCVPEHGIWIISPLTAVWLGPLMIAFTSLSAEEAAV
jgi:hypothetical protein